MKDEDRGLNEEEVEEVTGGDVAFEKVIYFDGLTEEENKFLESLTREQREKIWKILVNGHIKVEDRYYW